jgi:hypothetical protein
MFDHPYIKQPAEQETIRVSWADRIAAIPVAGYVISAVAVTVTDDAGVDVSAAMVVGVPFFLADDIFVTLAGGLDGENYSARFIVTLTKAGEPDQIDEDDLLIIVGEVVAAPPVTTGDFKDHLTADLGVFLNALEFGVTAIYTHNGSDPLSINAIFDDGFRAVEDVESYVPQILCKSSDVVGAAHGDTVTIGTATWYIRGIEADGSGLTSLRLSED